MTTVHDIAEFLESLAPAATAESWDNVGLLCGRWNKPVRRILVALDPFLPVCREAAELGADLLVTHHPLIFSPLKALTEDAEPGACALFLAEHGIAAINAHTNYDVAAEGVNQILAKTLGLGDIRVLDPLGLDRKDQQFGLLRRGTVPSTPLPEFLAQVKSALGMPCLRFCHGGKPVQQVAVGGGACAGELHRVAQAGCDTFITADVKYNQFRDAEYLGLNLIDAGHFYTENPAAKALARKLQENFPEIQVVFSQNHRDSMKFFP